MVGIHCKQFRLLVIKIFSVIILIRLYNFLFLKFVGGKVGKNFLTLTIFIALTFFTLVLQAVYAKDSQKCSIEKFYAEEYTNYNSVLLTSLDDLYFDQENIQLNIEGYLHSVINLQRTGNQWLVTFADPIIYCPKGHICCKGCHQCHNKNCWYYIRPCKLWDK